MCVGIYPSMALSDNFRLPYFTKSQTAEKLGLYNIPREVSEVANLKALCERVLEPFEARLKGRVRIVSGFRTQTLNRLIGGPRDSQHLLGEAADFIVEGMPAYTAVFTLAAQSDIPFDRLRLVHRACRDGSTKSYIHVSHRRMDDNGGLVETVFQTGEGRRTLKGIHSVEAENSAVAS